jgi:hypothetical protein
MGIVDGRNILISKLRAIVSDMSDSMPQVNWSCVTSAAALGSAAQAARASQIIAMELIPQIFLVRGRARCDTSQSKLAGHCTVVARRRKRGEPRTAIDLGEGYKRETLLAQESRETVLTEDPAM